MTSNTPVLSALLNIQVLLLLLLLLTVHVFRGTLTSTDPDSMLARMFSSDDGKFLLRKPFKLKRVFSKIISYM